MAASVRLSSLGLIVNQDYCFSFYYFMQDNLYGKLNVYITETTNGGKETLVWSKSEKQAHSWINANLDIHSGVDFIVEIEAERGRGYSVNLFTFEHFRRQREICIYL